MSLEVRCGPTDWAVVTGWQKLLLGLAVCLPIPMLALSGLALPLPAAVYRAATAFVASTQELATVFTGGSEADSSPPQSTVPSSAQQRDESAASPRPVVLVEASPRTAGKRIRTAPAVQIRRLVAQPAPTALEKIPGRKRPAEPVRAATAPAVGGTDGSHPEAPARAPQPAASAPAKEQHPSIVPSPHRVDPAPVEPSPIKHPVSPPPSPVAPPPSPPPALLEPVTKAVEPVKKPLEPITQAVDPVIEPVTDLLDPVTKPVLDTGRLLRP